MSINRKLNQGTRAPLVSLQRAFLGMFLAMGLSLLAACEEIEEEKPWIQVDRPQMLFTDTTLLDSYDKGILSWKLKTAYLERWADKEVIFMQPVLADIYDSLGERVAFLRADSGRMDMKFTYVYAYGHVYALTPKGASVRADSLLWNKRDNIVRTDSYVRVVSEDGDVLQGKGFESDAAMDNWKILSEVTGIFQDAAKRLKEEDKKQAEELEKTADSTAATDSTKNSSQGAAPAANAVPPANSSAQATQAQNAPAAQPANSAASTASSAPVSAAQARASADSTTAAPTSSQAQAATGDGASPPTSSPTGAGTAKAAKTPGVIPGHNPGEPNERARAKRRE